MAVADHSGQIWYQGFNDVGEMVLGITANELYGLKVLCTQTMYDILADSVRYF
jgi:replication factor A1